MFDHFFARYKLITQAMAFGCCRFYVNDLIKRCSQGVVLGPLLWNILFEDFQNQEFDPEVTLFFMLMTQLS